MDYTLFFEKNDQLCYNLLQKFAVGRNYILTQEAILETLPVSEYKLGQLLDTLNQDLSAITSTSDSQIAAIDKNVYRGHNITTTAVHEIRLMYLNRSVLFSLFNYNLLMANRESKETFRKKHFISKTKFYATQLELRDILNHSEFYESPSIIKDTEYVTRLRLFEFFYTAFNGIGSPFSEMDIRVNNLIINIQAQFNFVIKPVQRTKLEIFIKIWVLRMLNNQPMTVEIIPKDNLSTEVTERLTNIQSSCKHYFQLTLSDLELNYLYAFLVTQQYVPGIQTVLDQKNFPLAYDLSNQLVDALQSSNVLVNTTCLDEQRLRDTLIEIHLRFTTFYVEPSTFISFNQIDFFRETYPIFHTLVNHFIQSITKQRLLNLGQAESANLYFDYMFTLISCIPKELLHDRIYVCVDFSQGELYSNYIIQTLNGFSNANLVIETNLSANTDLYLSDFYTTTIKQPQIIWRNPPTPDDWAALGDLIIKLKQEKVARLVDKLSKEVNS